MFPKVLVKCFNIYSSIFKIQSTRESREIALLDYIVHHDNIDISQFLHDLVNAIMSRTLQMVAPQTFSPYIYLLVALIYR